MKPMKRPDIDVLLYAAAACPCALQQQIIIKRKLRWRFSTAVKVMQSSIILMEPLAELSGRDADDLREDAGEVIRVAEADGGRDLGDALIGEAEGAFGKLHTDLVDVDIDIDTGAPLEDAAEVGIAAMAELGQRGDGDAAFIVDADVFQRVGEDGVLA